MVVRYGLLESWSCQFPYSLSQAGNIARVIDSRRRSPSSSGPSRQWRRPVAEEHITQHSIPVASLIAAGASAALGIVVVFLLIMGIWLFAAHGSESTSQVVQAACTAWLSVHLVPVTISNTTLSLLPWGFIVVPVYILRKCTQWALKSAQPTQARQYWQITALVGVSYGVVAAAVSLFASNEGSRTNALSALVHVAVIGFVVAISAVIDYAPSRSVLLDRFPDGVAAGIRLGIALFAMYMCLGAVVDCVLLVMHWSEIQSVIGLMTTGPVDGFFLIVLALGYLPTASVWTLAYLLGATIHLGGVSAVSLTKAHPGALPAFPLFSLLPSTVPVWGKYAIALPILVGVLLYRRLPKTYWQPEGDDARSYFSRVVRIVELQTLLVALITLGAVTWMFVGISSGGLGNHLLKSIGPNPLDVTIAITITTGVTALGLLVLPRVVLILLRLWSERKQDAVA